VAERLHSWKVHALYWGVDRSTSLTLSSSLGLRVLRDAGTQTSDGQELGAAR
jgi:hypothetical protein